MLGQLHRRLHPSWLVAWFGMGFIGGIGLSLCWHPLIFAGMPALLAGIVLLGFSLRTGRRIMIAVALLAGLLCGLWRGAGVHAHMAMYRTYIGRSVTAQGTINDDVTRANGETGMKLIDVKIDGRPLGGTIWAGTISGQPLIRGDHVLVAGKLRPGFGAFAASLSYARLTGVAAPEQADVLRNMRDRFAAGLDRAVPQQAATLGLGYLTGQHNEISAALTQHLQLVGLIHLVLAGGYNVTIVVRFARRLGARASKYLGLLAPAFLLASFTLMAGFTAPMARTAVVTAFSLAAWYYGRKIHPLVLLPLAAAITAAADPQFVWGDVGWYLTFIAYGGLIVLAPLLKRILWPRKPSGMFKQILTDTVAVQIVTMPLIAYAFQQYSFYGLPANLLVLPLMPCTMLATALAGVGGMILPLSAAHAAGWPATQLLGYTAKLATWFAGAPGANAVARLGIFGLILAYVALAMFVYILCRKTHYDLAQENFVE